MVGTKRQKAPEWLRTRFDPGAGDPLVGLLYGSSRNDGGVNLSLFIDNDAARVLKPLIQGESEVALDAAGQSAFAAWIYKCALIFDAAEHGADGELATLRAGFMESRLAGPGCVMFAGSTVAPAPFELPGLKEKLGLRLFGVRPVNGTVRLNINGQASEIPIPGYQVLLGNLCVYLGGQVPPITPESLVGFEQVWPARDEPVVVRPWLVGEGS
jgi:hypothetical protein